MPIISPPYTQYGGIWKLNAASAAQGAGTWAVPPQPALLSWGKNTYGQLGQGNTTQLSSPKQIGSLKNWLSVSNGYNFSMFVRGDNTLWGCGQNNSYGQLGFGNTTNYSSPKQVGALTNWLSISCGIYHFVSIKTDGTLWACGANGFGPLGLGNTTNYSSPKQIGSLSNWSQCSAGGYSSMAVKTDGTLWAWGRNGQGNLGLNTTTNYSSPVQVGSLTDWKYCFVNNGEGGAIKTDGTIWMWGYNYRGCLGNGNTTNYFSPIQVGALTNWLTLTCGSYSTLATKTDGTLWSWGNNSNGQLGLNNQTHYSSPKQVGSLTNWLTACRSIPTFSQECSFAIKTDGTLWSWGNGANGQLGLGNVGYSYSSPKQVGTLTTWLSLSGSYGSVLAIAKT